MECIGNGAIYRIVRQITAESEGGGERERERKEINVKKILIAHRV